MYSVRFMVFLLCVLSSHSVAKAQSIGQILGDAVFKGVLGGMAGKAQNDANEKMRVQQAQKEAELIEAERQKSIAEETRLADEKKWKEKASTYADKGWMPVTKTDSASYYISGENLSIAKSTVVAWLKSNTQKPIKMNAQTFQSWAKQMEFDCENRATKVLAGKAYKNRDLKGTVVFDYSDYEEVETDVVVPGTPANEVFKFACALRN